MKTILKTFLATLLLIHLTAQAQQRVALHSNGVTTIFNTINPFVDAYNAAITGDTIYLSGGAFQPPTTIDKGLTIFGAGFHEDSTAATNLTKITLGFTIGENADNLHLEGLFFQATISTLSNTSFNNAHITRCYFNSSLTISGNSGNNTDNLLISETVFNGNVNIENVHNSMITNSIFEGQLSYTVGNLIQNNIFLRNGGSWSSASGRTIYNANSNTFKNNVIFNADMYSISGTGNTFEKNLFCHSSPELGLSPISINNYFGVTQSTVFVNQVGYTWVKTNDNHLLDPVTYVGTDNNPVGIYGGTFPFKAGLIPQNPHIRFKQIAPQTDTNGDLNIQIEVGAQNN